MLAARVATAAALIAALLGVLFLLPALWLKLLLVAAVALAAAEWARLCALAGKAPALYAAGMAAAFIALVLAAPADLRHFLFAAAGGFWVLVVPAWLARGVRPTQHGALALAGFAVLLPSALAMVSLAPGQVLLVLVLVWTADTAAYAVGRRVGRHRLAPAISPGKTWEGAAAGVGGALAYAIICGTFFEGIAWVPYLAAAALLAVLSVLGDLFESAAKRQASVKDSGRLLPGHGGLLDRIDSATAVLPLAALMAPWIVRP